MLSSPWLLQSPVLHAVSRLQHVWTGSAVCIPSPQDTAMDQVMLFVLAMLSCRVTVLTEPI